MGSEEDVIREIGIPAKREISPWIHPSVGSFPISLLIWFWSDNVVLLVSKIFRIQPVFPFLSFSFNFPPLFFFSV